jgi:transcriptional regulator with GAF, ATPase, and Fis domain
MSRVPATDLAVAAERVSGLDRELLSETFVELTDTMVADFDVIDFLHVLTDRSVKLLDVSAAGLLLADPRGDLRVVAASSEAARLLELFQLQNDQGPCLDCFRAGQPVSAADLNAEAQRWPRFAAAARQAGFGAVQALPMRLRDQVIGALNLFRASAGAFDPADVHLGQALADVATISLLHERSLRHSDILNEQLQSALNSRVVIEQAKGKLAERLGLDMEQAFALLRDYARNHNLRLAGLAQAFIDGTQTMADQTAPARRLISAPTGQVRRQPRPAAPHTPPRNGPPADKQPT